MENNGRTVEIMGGTPGAEGRYLTRVHDPASGTYFAPDISSLPPHFAKMHKLGFTGRGMVGAVLDTGVLSEHPLIRRNLIYSIDFTGEGVDDRNGHGTIVTCLWILGAPDMKLISVKVLDAQGRGRDEHLVQGMQWCIDNMDRWGILAINLSAGVFHRSWGIWDCNADCELCEIAMKVVGKGIQICAAAGNRGPDQIPCPQKIGLRTGRFLVVEAAHLDGGGVASYSGRGNVVGPTGFPMIPIGNI